MIIDTYGDALGYLVRTSEGADYARDDDREACSKAAKRLCGTLSQWGQKDGEGPTGWHMIEDFRIACPEGFDTTVHNTTAHNIDVHAVNKED